MIKKIALVDDEEQFYDPEQIDRILPEMSLTDSIKKWQNILDPEEEEEFEVGPEDSFEHLRHPKEIDEFGEEKPRMPTHGDTGVQSDQAFNSALSLKLEDIKRLAPAYGEDYGYSDVQTHENAAGDVVYDSYVAPASPKKKEELKSLLSKIYGKDMSGDISKLNDLEIRHALKYYHKIDTMEDKKTGKEQTKRENEEENVNNSKEQVEA